MYYVLILLINAMNIIIIIIKILGGRRSVMNVYKVIEGQRVNQSVPGVITFGMLSSQGCLIQFAGGGVMGGR